MEQVQATARDANDAQLQVNKTKDIIGDEFESFKANINQTLLQVGVTFI